MKIGLALLIPGLLMGGARPWTMDALMRLNTVSDPRIARDGATVAYVVRSVNPDRNAYDSEILIAPASGGASTRLATRHFSDRGPRWSDDGRMLAFLSGRDGITQVYISDTKGLNIRRVTNSPTNVTYFAWSHDSKYVGYLAVDAPTTDEAAQSKKGADAIVADQGYKYSRLYIIPVHDGEPRLITRGPRHVTSFDWAPDGAKVVYAAQETPRSRDTNRVGLYESDLRSARETTLVKQAGQNTDPHYSRDGRLVAFHSQGGTWNYFAARHVAVVPSGGGEIRYVTDALDADVFRGGTEFWWSADGAELTFVAGKGTRDDLFVVNLRRRSARCLIPSLGAPSASFSVSDDGKRVAFVKSSMEAPPDVYVAARRISQVNPQVEEYPFVPARILHWKSKDGLDVEGVLRLPFGYKPGTRVPLIVEIHGGPTGVAQETYPIPRTYPAQLYAQAGFAVLSPNFRGSANYGEKFRLANIDSQGFGDFDDIMTGVDTVIAQGIADPARLGVAGWSYGGFLTAWIIGHTDRFKAASIGAPASDWIGYYGASQGPRETLWTYFGGNPWEKWQAYNEHSPRYSLIHARTPSLLLHGERDVDSSAEIYQALTDLKVPLQFVTYPREPHNIGEPMHQRDLMQRNLDWFKRWLVASH